jgi:hypothetical protein
MARAYFLLVGANYPREAGLTASSEEKCSLWIILNRCLKYINNGSKIKSLLISVQLISSDSSFKSLLIMPSSAAVLNQNRFSLDFKTISSGFS